MTFCARSADRFQYAVCVPDTESAAVERKGLACFRISSSQLVRGLISVIWGPSVRTLMKY